jgi:hypothetical protein
MNADVSFVSLQIFYTSVLYSNFPCKRVSSQGPEARLLFRYCFYFPKATLDMSGIVLSASAVCLRARGFMTKCTRAASIM